MMGVTGSDGYDGYSRNLLMRRSSMGLPGSAVIPVTARHTCPAPEGPRRGPLAASWAIGRRVGRVLPPPRRPGHLDSGPRALDLCGWYGWPSGGEIGHVGRRRGPVGACGGHGRPSMSHQAVRGSCARAGRGDGKRPQGVWSENRTKWARFWGFVRRISMGRYGWPIKPTNAAHGATWGEPGGVWCSALGLLYPRMNRAIPGARIVAQTGISCRRAVAAGPGWWAGWLMAGRA